MNIQAVVTAFASALALLCGSPLAHADPDKDESRGKERREGRGHEGRGEHKGEFKDGERKYEWKEGGRKFEYKDEGRYEHKERRGEYEDRRGGREGRGEYQGRGHDGRRGSWFHEHGYSNLGIPDGHLPPPGECRVWYPGRPAGHQPPPGRCSRLSRSVPAGAWLMRRPDRQPEYVDVTVYDQRRPGVVLNVGIFDARTGSFVRIDASQ